MAAAVATPPAAPDEAADDDQADPDAAALKTAVSPDPKTLPPGFIAKMAANRARAVVEAESVTETAAVAATTAAETVEAEEPES